MINLARKVVSKMDPRQVVRRIIDLAGMNIFEPRSGSRQENTEPNGSRPDRNCTTVEQERQWLFHSGG